MNLDMQLSKKAAIAILAAFLLAALSFICIRRVCATPQFAITSKSGSGGRLGDDVHMYTVAKWFAYKYNIPFYATPFKHSDIMALDKVDTCLTQAIEKTFKQIIDIESEDELIKHLKTCSTATLFLVNFKTGVHFSSKLVSNSSWPDGYLNMYAHSREHAEFCTRLKKALTPIHQINPIVLPKDKVSVAVHIRKGSGDDAAPASIQYLDEWKHVISHEIYNPNDFPSFDRNTSFRFPPEQFYVDQLLKLSVMLNHCPLYVYIFTDDKDPDQLVQRLKKRVLAPNITFHCRQKKQDLANNKNVIMQDLCDMAQFDCLIRPESGFSAAAQLIGNHKLVVYPQAVQWVVEKSLHQAMLHIDNSSGIFCDPHTHVVDYIHFDEITQQHREKAVLLFSHVEGLKEYFV